MRQKIIRQTIAPDWAVYAEKLAAGADSVLAKLSQQDLDDGLAAVRRHTATEDGRRPVVEPIDLFVLGYDASARLEYSAASDA